MFNLVSFTTGSVLVGVVVTLLFAIIMAVCVPLLFGKQHTSLSYVAIVLFALVLLVLNIFFVGLASSKIELENYRDSYEYRLLQKGTDLLDQVSPELADFVSVVLGSDDSDGAINNVIEEINKYLWINGILCVVVFVIGVITTYKMAGQNTIKRKGHSRSVRRVPAHDDF